MKVNVEKCEFVAATSLIPRKWDSWFWGVISENAPFSWGDNNRSLVTARDFADHCANRVEGQGNRKWTKAVQTRIQEIRELGDMYVDLEN